MSTMTVSWTASSAAAVLSINAFKGVEFGIGFEAAGKNGSEVHDEIVWDEEKAIHAPQTGSED